MHSRLFVHLALVSCICLQRFGLTVGSSMLFLCLPAFGALLGWMMASGYARLSARVAPWYLVVALWFVVGAEVAALFPDARVESSASSLFAVLVSYALWTIEPTERFDTTKTLDIFLQYARWCAGLGIAQYLAQFVGVRLFSFSTTLPFLEPVLIERYYAFDRALGFDSTTLKSNGFFLLEPSLFSQLLVIAAVIDLFVRRRHTYLPLYAVAYLVSFSGTGFVSLVVAMAIYALTSLRGAQRLLLFAPATLVGVGLVALVAPDIFAAFWSRVDELQKTGSSAYARYIGPFASIETFVREARSYVGYGPGATERSVYAVSGSGNSLLKLFVDYGLVGVALFAMFAHRALVRSLDTVVPILCLTIFVIGGGMLLFSPFTVLVAVLCIWSVPPALPPATTEGATQ